MGMVKEGDILYAVIEIRQYPRESPQGYVSLYRSKEKADEVAKRSDMDVFTLANVYEVKVED